MPPETIRPAPATIFPPSCSTNQCWPNRGPSSCPSSKAPPSHNIYLDSEKHDHRLFPHTASDQTRQGKGFSSPDAWSRSRSIAVPSRYHSTATANCAHGLRAPPASVPVRNARDFSGQPNAAGPTGSRGGGGRGGGGGGGGGDRNRGGFFWFNYPRIQPI